MKTIEKFTSYKLGNVESKNVLGSGAREDALTNVTVTQTTTTRGGTETITYTYDGYTGEETWTKK